MTGIRELDPRRTIVRGWVFDLDLVLHAQGLHPCMVGRDLDAPEGPGWYPTGTRKLHNPNVINPSAVPTTQGEP